MLSYIEAYNARNIKLTLPLGDPVNPFQVKNIDGLGPVDATITSTSYSTLDGESYVGSNVGKRNIVITVKLNPWFAGSGSAASLRALLYSNFMPKGYVKLRFFDTVSSPVEIVGYVESVDPNLFSKDPEVQISVVCPSPYFYEFTSTVVTGTTVSGLTQTTIINKGTVPSGVVVDVSGSTAVPSYTGDIQLVNQAITVDVLELTSGVISASSIVRFNTNQGTKSVKQGAPANPPTNVLGKVTATSIWLQLQPGQNLFRVVTTTAGLNWTMTYMPRYGGL